MAQWIKSRIIFPRRIENVIIPTERLLQWNLKEPTVLNEKTYIDFVEMVFCYLVNGEKLPKDSQLLSAGKCMERDAIYLTVTSKSLDEVDEGMQFPIRML